MGETAQINIRVDLGTKEEFDEYVNEKNEHTTLSGFLRTAAVREMKGERGVSTHSPALGSDIDEIKEEIQQLKSSVNALVSQNATDQSQRDLAAEVRQELIALPKLTGPVNVPEELEMATREYRQLKAAESIILPQDAKEGEEGKNDQTLEAIGKRIGATSEEIKEAIDQLKDDFIPVVKVEKDGEIHYFLEQ